jgi:hypothetical protein
LIDSGVALKDDGAKEGPGESDLLISRATSSRRSTATERGAPHISQVVNEGWFSNVHLGHDTMPFVDGVEVEVVDLVSFSGGPGGGLLDMPAIAALTTWTVGGLIPQARHGGMGVREASAGSKFEGTGFENEHIGHTQVALCCGAGAGLLCRGGVVVGLPGAVVTDDPRESCFKGLG